MKKRIVFNYVILGFCIAISIAITVFVMINRLSKEELESIDLLIVVLTPFVALLVDLAIGKSCLTSIHYMKKSSKISLDNRSEVQKIGKDYKNNNIYVIKVSSSISFFGIVVSVIMIICACNKLVDFTIAIVVSILLILTSIVFFFIFLYYNKINKYDDYDVGKMFIENLKD